MNILLEKDQRTKYITEYINGIRIIKVKLKN